MKLKGFPSVYYLSLEESEDRREHLHQQFKNYGITNLTGIISKRFSECDDIIEGNFVHTLTDCSKGANTSQLRCLKKWLNETDEEYAFFCEDDLSLKTVEYWNFTWKDFIDNLPSDWDAIQLMTIKESFGEIKFREREWNDWSAAAYLIQRDYAQKIVSHCYPEDKFILNVLNHDNLQPITENVLFAAGKVYNAPLFVEEVYKFNATFINSQDFSGLIDGNDAFDGQGKTHITSHDKILNWWKGNNITLEKLMNISIDPLIAYALDTENAQKNFELARWYHKQGQTASAITYYLRAADRTDDLLLAYECLLHVASCFHDQKNRNYTVKGLYQHAINLLPKRPEAYFLLSRHEEWNKMYADCYTTASLGLNFCDFDLEPLSTFTDYPGKYGLIFEKAVSSYWWGKTEECRDLFQDLKNNYELDELHSNAVNDNIVRLKFDVDYQFPHDFDWGELSYEDRITIQREIINEKVYRFWEDVKKNDVVVDIGASVGAYAISILNQKPQKVYCIEPSKNLLKTLAKNCSEAIFNEKENPIVYANYGIVKEKNEKINIFGGNEEFESITFKDLIKKYSINHINYLKIDCEGGEYNIFTEENIDFLLNHVDFISMEVHLNYEGCREKFKHFRDEFLTQFKNYKVMSCTRQNIEWGKSLDIKDRIFDNDFIDNYTCEFMIYIKNQ